MARELDSGTAARATQRALYLLRVLDREHTVDEIHAVARAVRLELNTAACNLPTVAEAWSRPEVSKQGVVQPSMFE